MQPTSLPTPLLSWQKESRSCKILTRPCLCLAHVDLAQFQEVDVVTLVGCEQRQSRSGAPHTRSTAHAVDECSRVLEGGGRALLMRCVTHKL